jgi:hypothetical protein
MIWLLPHLFPLSRRDKLSLFLSLPVCRWSRKILTGEEGRGRVGAKLYEGEKAGSSLNHSILFGAKSAEKGKVSWSQINISAYSQQISENAFCQQ